LVKIKYLSEYTRKRNEAAGFYGSQLSSCSFIETPYRAINSSHVFHQYTLKVKNIDRDHFKKHIEGKGVPSMIYYPIPLHFQKAYSRKEFGIGSFPVTEQLSKIVISLPIHTEMTEEELTYICETIKEYPRHA
jgi:UDP-2-acetamido-2-deoxy-ribo-hexuluronate aminotransferase